MNNNRAIGITSLVFAALFFSLWGIFPRWIGLNFGIFFQSLARSSIILPLLAAVLFFSRKKWQSLAWRDYLWILAMSCFGFMSAIFFFVAINHLAVGLTYLTFYAVATLASFAIGYLIFGEKFSLIKIIALIICLIGLALIFSGAAFDGDLRFLIIAAFSGIGGAGWNVFSKKVSSKYSLLQITIIDYLNFFVLGLSAVLISAEPILWPDFSLPWLATAAFSVVVLAAAFLIFNGFRHLPVQTGSLLMLLEPVFAVILGWQVFQETISLNILTGGALILLGAALPNILKNNH
jgi:drug/metabolite transporter (DMT)-like permease